MELPSDVCYRWLTDDGTRHDYCLSLLSAEERERVHTFKAEKRRHEFALGRAAARELLAAHLKVRPQDVPLSVEEDGGVTVGAGDYHVSISHTARHAAAAIARRPVGVDLEALRCPAPRIHRYVYHPDDYALFERLRIHEDRAQILAWALKESALKARGSGLRYSPKRMRLSISLGDRTAFVEEAEGQVWNARFLERQGLVLAIAYHPMAKNGQPSRNGAPAIVNDDAR